MKSAVFITFPGNCKAALSFYQGCFGGTLSFEELGKDIKGFTGRPVVSGSLVSGKLVIHGSDLVHNEGRRIGNYISIYLHCKNSSDRAGLIKKLNPSNRNEYRKDTTLKLVEIIDPYDVRWIMGI